MKFLVDSSLGRLSKWLRILGYDTVYWRGEADRSLLREAEKEGRAVLTRRKDMLKRNHSGIVVLVENARMEHQIGEVLKKLDLTPEPEKLFTLCLRCNESLKEAKPEQVRPLVPDYVFRTQQEFRMCPGCSGVFWPGTHRERIMKMLEKLLAKAKAPEQDSSCE
jgi:uncharacterized protein